MVTRCLAETASSVKFPILSFHYFTQKIKIHRKKLTFQEPIIVTKIIYYKKDNLSTDSTSGEILKQTHKYENGTKHLGVE